MRLFIGVPLPGAARARTAGLLGELRDRSWPVRWVRDDGLHLTLKFFGEVTSDRLASLEELLTFATAGLHPMAQRLDGLGVFPNRSRPRILHLRVEAGSDLELLQDRLERGAERLGFPPEGRPFRPHVTLGRVREGHRLPDGWEAELDRVAADTPYVADRVILYESRLGPTGPAYEARHTVHLG